MKNKRFHKYLENASKNKLNATRIKVFRTVQKSTLPKDSKQYDDLVEKYLTVVRVLEDRFGPPEERYSAIRCDGTVCFGPCHTPEEELFYLAWESAQWEEPTEWRMMTEAEIARYNNAVENGGHNPFGPEDFRISG